MKQKSEKSPTCLSPSFFASLVPALLGGFLSVCVFSFLVLKILFDPFGMLIAVMNSTSLNTRSRSRWCCGKLTRDQVDYPTKTLGPFFCACQKKERTHVHNISAYTNEPKIQSIFFLCLDSLLTRYPSLFLFVHPLEPIDHPPR